MELLLASTSAATYTIWLLALWLVIIPAFGVVAIMFALAQTAGERAENLAYARGERPDNDPDVIPNQG